MSAVGFSNRFDALQDESAELEPSPAPAPASDKKAAAKAPAGKAAPVSGKDNGTRGAVARKADAPATTAATDDSAPPRRRDDRGGPPRSGGKGGKGARTGGRGPKHEGGDRPSHSYQRREGEKSQTNGPGSWGKPDEDGSKDSEVDPEAAAKREPRAPRQLTAEEEEREAQIRKEREEEEKQMTLEEYRARAAQGGRELPKERVANEGSEDKQFAKQATLLTKEALPELFTSKKAEPKVKAQKERKEKEAEKIMFEPKSYSEEARDRRPPREAGKGGGKGSRGGPRGSRVPPPPVVDDKESFPTLGGKK